MDARTKPRLPLPKWAKTIEHIVDKAIPPMLIVLLGVIVIEIFFHDIAEHYHTWILLADHLVLWTFVLDVFFKFIRIRPFKTFLRKSWIDILAIFPFLSMFRLFEGIFGIFVATEGLKEGQLIFHETVEVQKETVRIAQEVEKAGKVSRTSRFSRFLRPIEV